MGGGGQGSRLINLFTFAARHGQAHLFIIHADSFAF
jgi:hypothetical protein